MHITIPISDKTEDRIIRIINEIVEEEINNINIRDEVQNQIRKTVKDVVTSTENIEKIRKKVLSQVYDLAQNLVGTVFKSEITESVRLGVDSLLAEIPGKIKGKLIAKILSGLTNE